MSTEQLPSEVNWRLAYADRGGPWESDFFLDGALGCVTRNPDGLVLKSGAVSDGDAGHAVLWTRQSFTGDLLVEWDFTRLDHAVDHTSVCILYLHATGTGNAPYLDDIDQWSHLRRVPSMSLYFKHMQCWHISYACSGPDGNYIRARRYPTRGQFRVDTLLHPSYDDVRLFSPGETWHMVSELRGSSLSLSASRNDVSHNWNWDLSEQKPLVGGRIGFRQMLGRESRYANLRISTRE